MKWSNSDEDKSRTFNQERFKKKKPSLFMLICRAFKRQKDMVSSKSQTAICGNSSETYRRKLVRIFDQALY